MYDDKHTLAIDSLIQTLVRSYNKETHVCPECGREQTYNGLCEECREFVCPINDNCKELNFDD